MAVTSIHSIKATVGAAIAYITDGDKTVNGVYVNSYACRADSRGAAEDFRAVRDTGTGRTKILAYHLIQSFAPNEVTPEQAMQIGEELCDRYLKGDYQYVLAVHTDKQHTHIHVIFNNTNIYNGLSFTTEHNQGKKTERAWAELRQISDEICTEHGISVIEPKGKGVSHFERDMQIEGKSWKDKLRAKIAEVAFYSKDFANFLQRCTECGIEYVYKPQNKVKLKFRLSGEGQQKFTRADTLGENYTAEKIAEQIEQIQKAQAIMERLSEKKKPEKPAPVTVSTTKPTAEVSAPTTPSSESVHFIADTVLARMREKGITPPTPAPKPTQPVTPPKPVDVKAPENKRDPWSPIRGMGKADEIIADLESVGINSYSEFMGFMYVTQHDDDHTDELAYLNSSLKEVATIISKMKHYDEVLPTYKEYKSLSGFKQSRFRKKHSDQIEDFEQTRDYIKEHSTKYTSDGSIPSLKGVRELHERMKARRDEILPEHNAFLAKRDVAKRYTRQVRHYTNEQHNKREREKSIQKKLTQQRKKDYLE